MFCLFLPAWVLLPLVLGKCKDTWLQRQEIVAVYIKLPTILYSAWVDRQDVTISIAWVACKEEVVV